MKAGKICASIGARSCEEVIRLIRDAEPHADLMEIRFDHLDRSEVDKLLDLLDDTAPAKPMIATYRPAREGGYAPDEPAERLKFWERAGSRFWAVDLEEDIFDLVRVEAKRILSHHDLAGGRPDHKQTIKRLLGYSPDILKFAYTADDITDSIAVFEWLAEAGSGARPMVPIAMGEAGKITRILGPAHGSEWTYAAAGETTAPGQLGCRELEEVYRISRITKSTRVFGVIGNPVSNSRSPRIHNAAFAEAGIDAVFVPLTVRNIGDLIRRMVRRSTREIDLNFGGFAVTMPHKLSIIEHLDEIDDVAASVGAVNTVKIKDDKLYGYNTDAEGFIRPLRDKYGSLSGAAVAVVGAGGAARACLYALQKEGAAATVLARDISKGESVAGDFGAKAAALNDKLENFDIVVNATPIGMNGDESSIPVDGIDRVKMVYDLVTSVSPTPFIKAARSAGVETISGVEMLCAQAERQFEIWTGLPAPADIMRTAAGGTDV